MIVRRYSIGYSAHICTIAHSGNGGSRAIVWYARQQTDGEGGSPLVFGIEASMLAVSTLAIGVQRLSDVATVSRTLARVDNRSVDKLRELNRQQVLQRLSGLGLARITLDYDGSVLSSGRFAKGSAVGFNCKKKGQRSYYPLFCTVAQTGQILDVWHRPDNVHDSNGAEAFIPACIREIRIVVPRTAIEVRMDSVFFLGAIVGMLNVEDIEFTISVPFEYFTELEERVEARRFWRHLNAAPPNSVRRCGGSRNSARLGAN